MTRVRRETSNDNTGVRDDVHDRLWVRTVMALGGLAFLTSGLWTAGAFVYDFGSAAGRWSAATGWQAVLSNAGWFTLFVLHHSAFARAGVKARVAALAGPLERSIYVWASSVLLGLVVWRWTPVPGIAWQVTGPARWLLIACQIGGLCVTVLAARELGVLRLAGMRAAAPAAHLRRDGLYGFVRHPIYFAWCLLVWPTPMMTGSRLTFAALTTIYLVAAVPLEERSLRREFGPAYDDYRKAVRWRILPGLY